jgi:hypothetical protein
VTFHGSSAQQEWSGRRVPLYDPADTYTGVLLSAVVEASQFVWWFPPPHPEHGLKGWTKGEFRPLFINGSAESLCAGTFPRQMTLISDPQCCDTVTMKRQCLVPGSIDLVVEARADAWHPHQKTP